ncbi:cyclopropane-fatty-acyl-phospholipid synthase [Salinisphaera sp. PC39]|uniref:SAM-dependent methyltransferase n=1 Tax=Salinisphaera sp. PC39 TaxID=1304156 RepID=UPI003342D59E
METLPIELCERGLVPDALARAGMRRLIASRLTGPEAEDGEARNAAYRALVAAARTGPIARHTDEANDQHYEVPADFFTLVLGPRLKYSGCLFADGIADLGAAEEAMLGLYAERAGLADGQRILDLGCGWGSFCLWAAARYPDAEVHAVSNSAGQRAHIEARAAALGLGNLRVETCDINRYEPAGAPFDRVVSVEMFEHMSNHRALMARIADWLAPDGRFFLHIFCHRLLAYPFATGGRYDWMGRHFFTGGLMPSENWPLEFQTHLTVRDHWWVSGRHYRATADAWLANLDARRDAVRALFADAYGAALADRQRHRWRMFFMAVSELFGFEDGNQWGVGHYLFGPRAT